jgi:branched-chain amino acid transport system ATP-binding protein
MGLTKRAVREEDHVLALESATVEFGGITALRGISLTVSRGEYVGLIGPNGSGKTTLLNLVNGIVAPASGEVLLGHVRCTKASTYKRARLGIGRSFQRAILFGELSVADHLQLAVDPKGLLPARRARGVDDRLDSLREDLQAEPWRLDLTEPVSNLALGGIRAVELAMALLASPKLLLLDEPLSGLDQVERRAYAALTLQARDDWDVTIVMVEHDVDSVVRLADRLIVLDFGVKIADGPTASVIRDEAVRNAYFGTQPDLAPAPEPE